MLTLYVKTGCPFCAKVLGTVEELGLQVSQKNIAEPGVVDELIARGGQKMVPFLVDEDRGVSMYESDDIVAYLREHYSS